MEKKYKIINLIFVGLFLVLLFLYADNKISEIEETGETTEAKEEINEISEIEEETNEVTEAEEEVNETIEKSREADNKIEDTEQDGKIIYENDQVLCKKVLDEDEINYELILYSKDNKEVFSMVHLKQPGFREVTEDVLEIRLSVGSPAVYVFYFNKETLAISDPYFNPIRFGDKYVAYMEDGKYNELILTDFFQEGLLYKKIDRNFSITAAAMSAIESIEMIDNESIQLTYFEGEDFTEVSEIISLN